MPRLLAAAALTSIAMALLAPVALLGLPFWLTAGLTRLVHGRLMAWKRKVTPWQQLIEYAPVVGWKPKANMSTYAYADKPFRVTTDRDGWRGKARLEEADVVVFGDSYAFGYGVGDGRYFANICRRTRVKCIGINGYNMVQTLLWMQRLAPKLDGKLVVWFVYHGNDLYENLQPNLDKYPMPFVRSTDDSSGWEIVTEHVRELAWHGDGDRDYYSALAEICTPTSPLSARAFSACEYLIREAQSLCRRAGARLMVMSIPDITQISELHLPKLVAAARDPAWFDPRLPDTRLAELCGKLCVPFIALREHLGVEDHKLQDAHWNERGHRRIAELLEQLHAAVAPAPVSAAVEPAAPVPGGVPVGIGPAARHAGERISG